MQGVRQPTYAGQMSSFHASVRTPDSTKPSHLFAQHTTRIFQPQLTMDLPIDLQNDIMKSPLQQLELQTAKARSQIPNTSPTKPQISLSNDISPTQPQPHAFDQPDDGFDPRDRDSIYSFDSVSTNGRLLDRLGLELEEFDERFDRLSISDFKVLRNLSIQRNPHGSIGGTGSSASLNRLPLYRSKSIFNLHPSVNLNRQNSGKDMPFTVKNVPSNVVQPNRNKSIDSFKASLLSDTGSISSKRSINRKFQPIEVDNNEYDEFNFNSSSDSIENSVHRNRSVSASVISSPQRIMSTKRSVSDYTNTSSNLLADLGPEERTKLSFQLRSTGKHREASYQLQIAASPPFNYPKAMYLYAMSLKLGNGVKQSDKSCLKWLCKCILSSIDLQDSLMDKISLLSTNDLLVMVTNQIKNDTSEIDPIKLNDYYSKLSPNQISKLVKSVKSQSDHLPLAYQELGNFFLNGWSVDKDEFFAIKCLLVSASMGNFNSMIQLGEIWSTKTKNHKKDNYKASAWLRLSEIFGVKTIGNSWIYKEKYLERK